MMKSSAICFFLLLASFFVQDGFCQINDSNSTLFQYVSRSGWNARIPNGFVERYWGPASHVFILNADILDPCESHKECIETVKELQDIHMDEIGYNDIAYSFIIDTEGEIYAGRGFQVVGQFAPGFNDKGVGICFIGAKANDDMVQAMNRLISFGVQQGNIIKNYEMHWA